jgi:hypothetical protein
MMFWLVSSGEAQLASQKGLVLFTPQEAEQLRLTADEWQPPSRTRTLRLGPRIVIQRPQVVDAKDGPLMETNSPTDFFVVFEAHRAAVNMDSLQITAKKGLFSKSLTARLRPYIQGTSLQAKAVTIPTGRFLIQIEIADDHGVKTDGHYLLLVREQ